MPNYTDDMNQTATYWSPGVPDTFGNVVFGSPVTLACRWQNKTDLIRTPDGREVVSSAVIYPEYELTPQGWLYLGDAIGTADPRTLAAAYEILNVGSSPDLDDDETLWKAWL